MKVAFVHTLNDEELVTYDKWESPPHVGEAVIIRTEHWSVTYTVVRVLRHPNGDASAWVE